MKSDAITAQWTRSRNDEIAVEAGCWFDLKAAERVKRFFEANLYVPPPQAAGGESAEPEPFRVLDWQWRDVIGPLFGWKRPDGRRRFNRGYLSTAKKNGKTGLSSGLVLYSLMADREPRPVCVSVASSRAQAGLVYGDASSMVRASPTIAKMVECLDSTKTITFKHPTYGTGYYKTLAADSDRNEGIGASLIIYDELHAAKSRSLFDAMRYAGSARRQPLMLVITTAGDGNDPGHICREQYDYAKSVLKGEHVDPSFFALVYEAPEAAPIDDRDAWRLANPSIGQTIRIDDMEDAMREAKQTPAKEASFRRYRLNQWVSSAQAWLTDGMWDACPATPGGDDLEGQACFGGLDLSSTSDMTAFVLLFPQEGRPFRVLSWFYVPEANLRQLADQHRAPYLQWAKDGFLIPTPGNVVDYDAVREHVRLMSARFKPSMIGIDRQFQGQWLESKLIEDGLPVAPVGAGWRSQSEPLKQIEKWVRAGQLDHGGHPIMRWHALNARVVVDKAENYSLTKEQRRQKIDGVAALTMAVHCMLFAKIENEVELRII